ncbi:hypothetical protein C9I98_03250 [Photobacterium sanctipauli]|uniref:Uncharacterized protein n=1 Tax=Photobacterium sanctipauli TaxID=1342794 RepID=A0A2T3P1C7_9GAMM|nr:hypothetical protein C9I98_03250 [Photobacterium sanctipauli]
MFRAYAIFSSNHSKIHIFNLVVVMMVFAFSCYQLLANENLIFSNGLLFSALMIGFFARSSSYKRKYFAKL